MSFVNEESADSFSLRSSSILDMGTLANDPDIIDPNLFPTLGLIVSSKAVNGSPQVLSRLSSFLERSVQRNQKLLELSQIKDSATVFHGMRSPAISIRQYLDRIFKYSGCSPSCFVIARIYLDRLLEQADVHLSMLNVHRLLITSVLLAVKVFDDRFFSNAYYARVGGVTTRELNRLEMKFLFTLEFKLQVSLKTFSSYCSRLEKETGEGFHIERPIQTCRAKDTWPEKPDSACAQTITR